MSTLKRHMLSLGLASLLIACGSQSKDTVIDEAKAGMIAEGYVREKYPEINRSSLKPRTTDHGKYWFVAYDPPEGHMGGGPKIVIEKSTGKVAASFMDQ